MCRGQDENPAILEGEETGQVPRGGFEASGSMNGQGTGEDRYLHFVSSTTI